MRHNEVCVEVQVIRGVPLAGSVEIINLEKYDDLKRTETQQQTENTT